MGTELVGVIGLILAVVALFLRFWLGTAFLVIGFLGYCILEGWERALLMLPMQTFTTMTKYDITALPMFMLMAAVTANTGVSGDLYRTARIWLGQIRGGLAMATIAASAMFAAISGSSMTTAVAVGKAAYPELKKYGYDDRLACGSIACGGTIGLLIPPSIGFIIYGILTETSIGRLFMAGIIPGLMEAVLYILTVYVVCLFNKDMGPPGEKTSIKDKIVSLKETWSLVALFLLVMGGIYFGIFTPTEAGAVGAFGAILITFVTKRLSWDKFMASIKETAQNMGMIILILVGSTIFMRFLTISHLPRYLGETVAGLSVHPMTIIMAVIIFYLLAGAFMDIVSAIFITVPIFFPIIMELGYDPLWFGVIVVMMFEIGAITPPMGLNVFVLSATIGAPVGTIFRGIVPFLIADILRVLIIVFIPSVVLYLPMLMRGR